ncbi:MAG: hypothetical protein R3A48_20815 [Polyangiales bacterium]
MASSAFEPSGFSATWQAHVYEANVESGRQFLALVLGSPTPDEPTLVRMHPGAMFADLFAPARSSDGAPTVGGGTYLFEAMRRIEREGCGVVVYVPPRRIDLTADLACLATGTAPRSHDLAGAGSPAQREHGLGAQLLVDLGVRKLRLMTNNPRRLVGLAGYGLEVVDMVALSGKPDGRWPGA